MRVVKNSKYEFSHGLDLSDFFFVGNNFALVTYYLHFHLNQMIINGKWTKSEEKITSTYFFKINLEYRPLQPYKALDKAIHYILRFWHDRRNYSSVSRKSPRAKRALPLLHEKFD